MTAKLDLRGEVCPYTFVKTKLMLEELEGGQDLTILLDDSAATANVSRSLCSEGHEILDLKALSGEVWQIVVKKK
ncbi:MAG: sulfurtransferase TusA family protein [Methanothrix sp.]|nr:sulfurtransferase TusA family protein [Methanothrix sp.]MDD4447422.1 sulfurtransferase TusA family protein [Methanothrix sp.]